MYNTMFDVGFTIVHNYEDPYDIPVSELIDALQKRIAHLKSHPSDAKEAFGVCDTYEVS